MGKRHVRRSLGWQLAVALAGLLAPAAAAGGAARVRGATGRHVDVSDYLQQIKEVKADATKLTARIDTLYTEASEIQSATIGQAKQLASQNGKLTWELARAQQEIAKKQN